MIMEQWKQIRMKDGGNLGKKDTITKEYMRNPIVFADAFNKYLYHGRQVIKPEKLKELDTTEIAVPYGNGNASVPEQRYRDVLKTVMTDGNTAYCILGIENASDIHYAISVKNGLYDFMQLARQVSETAKSHKRREKESICAEGYRPSQGEYLGGFYKTDRLIPVLTLTVFYSAEEWDGPLTLREMYSAADEEIMQYVPDYKVNLIAPGNMAEKEIEEFHSSLKEVMLYIKYSKDKKKLQEVTEKNKNFRSLERQAAEVIRVVTNSKLKYQKGQEAVDMCAALEEMKMDSRIEGEIKGSVETYREVDFSIQETVKRIAEKFSFSLQKSEEEVRKYWK